MRPEVAIRREHGRKAQDAIALSRRLGLPLIDAPNADAPALMLEYRSGRLALCDHRAHGARPVYVDLEGLVRRYRSLPAAKRGPLAQAIGRRTRSIVDATAGWAQDLGLLVAMGYRVTAVERSPVMAVLLEDGLSRLAAQSNVRGRLEIPRLVVADAVHYLSELCEPPDCVYLDPMFPPKRKQSALARRRLRLLRELVGDDEDRQQLFASALETATKRVVVKRPDEAPPIADYPDETFAGKLVCYDVYLHGYQE